RVVAYADAEPGLAGALAVGADVHERRLAAAGGRDPRGVGHGGDAVRADRVRHLVEHGVERDLHRARDGDARALVGGVAGVVADRDAVDELRAGAVDHRVQRVTGGLPGEGVGEPDRQRVRLERAAPAPAGRARGALL